MEDWGEREREKKYEAEAISNEREGATAACELTEEPVNITPLFNLRRYKFSVFVGNHNYFTLIIS